MSLKSATRSGAMVVATGILAGLVAVAGGESSPLVPFAALLAVVLMWLAYTRPVTTIYVAILLIPFETLSSSVGSSFVLVPTKITALAAAFGWLARRLVRREDALDTMRSPLTWPLLLLLLAHIPGLFLAADPYAVLKEIVIWAAWYVLFLAVVADAKASTTRTLAIVISITGAIVAGIACVKTAGTSQSVFQAAGQVTNRAEGSFTSPVALGIFVTVIIPLQIVLMFRGESPWIRVLGTVGAALSVTSLALALTRGAFLSFSVVVVWLIATWRPIRRPAFGLLVLLIVLVISGFNPAPSVINPNLVIQRVTSINSGTYTAQLRFEVWQGALKMIEHNPIFGIGAKNFPAQSGNYGLVFAQGAPSNAHDTLLVIASELGIPGLMALFWMIAAVIRMLRRSLSRLLEPERSYAVALAATFLALVVDGITDYSYGEDSFFLTVVLLFALLARLDRTARRMPVTAYEPAQQTQAMAPVLAAA